jgi:hypothetical protein
MGWPVAGFHSRIVPRPPALATILQPRPVWHRELWIVCDGGRHAGRGQAWPVRADGLRHAAHRNTSRIDRRRSTVDRVRSSRCRPHNARRD